MSATLIALIVAAATMAAGIFGVGRNLNDQHTLGRIRFPMNWEIAGNVLLRVGGLFATMYFGNSLMMRL